MRWTAFANAKGTIKTNGIENIKKRMKKNTKINRKLYLPTKKKKTILFIIITNTITIYTFYTKITFLNFVVVIFKLFTVCTI